MSFLRQKCGKDKKLGFPKPVWVTFGHFFPIKTVGGIYWRGVLLESILYIQLIKLNDCQLFKKANTYNPKVLDIWV